MTTRSKPLPDAPDYGDLSTDVEYATYAPGVFLAEEGAEIRGRLVTIDLSPADHPAAIEYGQCVIITFAAVAGAGIESKATGERGPVDIVPGEEYALWLTSQTLHDSFVEKKVMPGELFAVKHFGTRTSRDRKDKDNNPIEYALYRVATPERPKEVRESLTWEGIALKGKKPSRP